MSSGLFLAVYDFNGQSMSVLQKKLGVIPEAIFEKGIIKKWCCRQIFSNM